MHKITMEQGDQISGLKKKLKKNSDDALQFVHQIESTLTEFQKTGNFPETYTEVKKIILDYKDKLVNQ